MVTKAGCVCCKLPADEDEEEEEAPASLSAANETSVDAAVVEDLSEPDGIFTFKEEETGRVKFSLYS